MSFCSGEYLGCGTLVLKLTVIDVYNYVYIYIHVYLY